MAWTYDPGLLASNRMMQVRLLVGDTMADDPQLQDEEITLLLSLRRSVYGAAADCCRSLAARMAREADSVQGELHVLYSGRSRAYAAMAARFEAQAVSRSGALPYAGGISIADKDNQVANDDRVQPQFTIGLEDNFLPAGIVGNETVEP